MDRIRADQGLNDRERKRQLARVILASRDQMTALRQESAQRSESMRRNAYVGAFGVDPACAAEERAIREQLAREQPSAVEVRSRMESALRVEDFTLAKCLGAYAFDNRDSQLGGDTYRESLDLFANSHHTVRAAMIRLAEVSQGEGNSGADRMQRLSDKLLLEVTQPHDLGPGSLDALAADDQPAQATSAGMPFLGNPG
jgi:hypothetical protein